MTGNLNLKKTLGFNLMQFAISEIQIMYYKFNVI